MHIISVLPFCPFNNMHLLANLLTMLFLYLVLQAPEADYLDAAVVSVLQIHLTQPPGDVLVSQPPEC